MKLKLVATKPETADVVTFVFEPEQPVSWVAGQYIHYTLPHADVDDRGDERWFTVSTAPSRGQITITTRIAAENGSSFKRALQALQVGQTVEAEAPEGDFVWDDLSRNYILIAGGIGVTPYHAMLVEAAASGKMPRAKLLYANRSADDIPFKTELDQLAIANPNLTIEYVIDPDRLDTARLQAELAGAENPFVYVSGPEPMVEAMNEELKKLGVTEENLKGDYFPGYEAE